MKKYHIIYKTTCLVNGRYYIGCHATDELNDGYLGSGVELLRDVYRYGKSAFVRETLYECGSREEAALKEREVVNTQVVADPKCYNKVMGGQVSGVKIGVGQEAYEERKKRQAARKRERYHEDPAFRQRLKEEAVKNWGNRYRNDPEFRAREKKRTAVRKRKKYQNNQAFREHELERSRKRYRKKKFKQKLLNSTELRSAFVLRCKADETLLGKILELFKHDAEFCSLLKNLVEK